MPWFERAAADPACRSWPLEKQVLGEIERGRGRERRWRLEIIGIYKLGGWFSSSGIGAGLHRRDQRGHRGLHKWRFGFSD